MPYFNPYGQMQMQMPPYPIPQQSVTTFYNVPSEEVARRWDVAPNSTAKFINETEGFLYKKSVGMSILEPPVFEVFEIVKRGSNQEPAPQTASAITPDMSEYMTKSEFESYKTIIDEMQKIVKELNGDG